MKQSALTKQVSEEIKNFFKQSDQLILFHNELDFQLYLALYFMQECGHHLFLEYHVPPTKLKGCYPWRKMSGELQEMYVDMVIYNEEEFVPIELKYKTKQLVADYPLFGCMNEGLEVIKNQGAQDLGMYGFWKDVRRLEIVRDSFNTVKNGIAIMLTNDPYYMKRPMGKDAQEVNYYNFRMNEERDVSGCLKWNNEKCNIAIEYPAFALTGSYRVHWEHITLPVSPNVHTDFGYCMVIV